MAPVNREIKRIVVIGSECTGKTTLARELAGYNGAAWSGEYAREYLERKGPPLTAADVAPIARGQLAAEDAALRQARALADAGLPPLVIHDTSILSTIIYARHYYGDCPTWIETELARRACHLYLLAAIDVPWEADGAQRDRPEQREQMHALFENALRERGLPFVLLHGDRQARFEQAIERINALLGPMDKRTRLG